jgi:4a-hydroxytetrahydrobiopterin dehydratase
MTLLRPWATAATFAVAYDVFMRSRAILARVVVCCWNDESSSACETPAMSDAIDSFAALLAQKCTSLKGKENATAPAHARAWLALLPDWDFGPDNADIRKQFRFPDFAHALAFVNALGWIAERENHHPDLELGWGRVLVRFSTHDVGGLSRNDFICAAKTEALLHA